MYTSNESMVIFSNECFEYFILTLVLNDNVFEKNYWYATYIENVSSTRFTKTV